MRLKRRAEATAAKQATGAGLRGGQGALLSGEVLLKTASVSFSGTGMLQMCPSQQEVQTCGRATGVGRERKSGRDVSDSSANALKDGFLLIL